MQKLFQKLHNRALPFLLAVLMLASSLPLNVLSIGADTATDGTANGTPSPDGYIYDENGVPTLDYKEFWGIGGTNYCKNLTYDTCTLSRFDAHMGLYNGKVINSTVNVFELTGGGDFLIENTKIYQIKGRNSVIELRHDYGGTWNGTFTIRNCEVFCISEKSTTLITSPWENHNFGYTCYLPNVIVDGIKFDKELSSVSVFWSSNLDDGTENDTLIDGTPNKNPRVAPSFVKIINSEGFYYVITNCSFLKDVSLEGVTRR